MLGRWLKRLVLVLVGILGLVVVAAIVLVVLLQRGYFDGTISRQASKALGREVVLTGPIDLSLWNNLSVGLGPVTVGNPDWAAGQGITGPMATVDRAEASLAIWPLLSGRIVIPRVLVKNPVGELVRLEDGRANWQFPTSQQDQAQQQQPQTEQKQTRLPEIGEVHVEGGRVGFKDAMTKRDLLATLDAAMTPGDGRYDVKADLGVADRALKEPRPQTASLTGWITDPMDPAKGFELTTASKADHADALLALAGVKTDGPLPAYDVNVTVAKDDEAWRVKALDASLGDTTVKGQGQVTDPSTLAGLQFQLDARSPKPGDLMAQFGLGRRQVPGLDLSARARTDGNRNLLTIAGKLGDDDIDVAASTEGPLGELKGLRLDAKAKGTNLGRLLPLAGLTEKPVPAYALDAQASQRGEAGANIDAKLTLGRTTLTAKGAIDDLKTGQGVDLQSTAQGQDLSEILDIFGLPKISIPPYKVAGRVGRNGDIISVKGLDGRVGNSDVAGDLAVDIGQNPAFVSADLTSNRVDFADLAGLVGGTPGAAPGKVASPEQKQQARELAAEQRIIPDSKIDADAWRNLNLDVRFKGKSVEAPKVPIQNLAFHVVTKNGLITLDPFQATVAQGVINANAAVDGRKDPVQGAVDLRVRRLQLNEFMKRFNLQNDALGVFSGRVQLNGTGDTVRQLAATADGRMAFTMEGGSIDALLPQLGGLDIGQAVMTFLRRKFGNEPENTQIRCAIADLPVQNGIVDAKTILVDTPSDKLTVEGKVSLRSENMDLVFHAYPRDVSIVSSRMPIAISGPIRSPSIAPAPGYIQNKPLAWAVAPFAALLPFVELGSDDEQPCAGLNQ